MTREEAIYQIKNLAVLSSERDMASITEALNMAIEALEHEQKRREDIYECSNCLGEVHINYIYCPFCGIKVGEQNNDKKRIGERNKSHT